LIGALLLLAREVDAKEYYTCDELQGGKKEKKKRERIVYEGEVVHDNR